jgi:mannose-6-phosphate isomerase-like protein (cupin superfamily)
MRGKGLFAVVAMVLLSQPIFSGSVVLQTNESSEAKTLPQTATQHPLTLPLTCEGGDCPLLTGAPQTAGMRSGFVRLKPGATVGWHTTGEHEEALVILRGQGEAQIEGHAALPITSQMEVYIPPAMRHNVANTGSEILEYVYVVAPAAKK